MIKVLLVDDDPAITTLIGAKLEESGRFSVVSTNNPRQAVRLALEEQPAIVICDVDMPGLDGGGVASALADKEATRRLPLIFLSSLITAKDSKAGMTSGGRPMVSKSAPIEELIAKVDKALAAASS